MRTRLAAVFLLSAAGLLFQFAQTRLFSATLSYHLSFLVVGGALLGVAGAGTASAIVDGRRHRPASATLAFAAAVATIVALVVETQVDPLVVGMFAATAVAYGLGVVPVLLATWVIVRALRESPAASGTTYAADLAGAAAGGIIGYVLLSPLGDQGLFALAAGLSIGAATLLTPASIVRRAAGLTAAVALVAVFAAWGEVLTPPRAGPLKSTGTDLAGGMTRDTARWDPLARIDVMRWGDEGDASHYRFLVDATYPDARPPSLAMELDMGALTPIIKGTSSADLAVLDASILSAPYELAPRRSVLVIGPGGGVDVMTALRHGSESVTAVEVNRTVIELLRGRYAAYTSGLYSDPKVHLTEDEARSFVRRSSDHYDLIVMTVVDSFAALSSGAYALTESYLYTREALVDYLSHLAPGGTIALSRWYREPPDEIVRTFTIAEEGLAQLGHRDPQRNIIVLKYGNFGMLVIGDHPFSSPEVDRVDAFAGAHGFQVAYDPRAPGAPFTGVASEAPATDDRPFFFDTVPLGDVLRGLAELPYGYAILLSALLLSTALALGGAVLPIYAGARAASGRLVPAGTGVSLAIGCGFIAAELVVLQRLTLYLGQPSLALAIGIASLLGGAAAGSALSPRIRGSISAVAAASAAVLLLILLGLPLVTGATLAAALPLRILVALAAAASVGVPLGTVFPKIVGLVGARDPRLVSWVWATNGAASVIGSILGSAIALAAGFTALGLAAVACYGIAAMASSTALRSGSAPSPAGRGSRSMASGW